MASKRALVLVLLAAAGAQAQALVGPGVGNVDTLISEGTRAFNKKQYGKAADAFLKATRAAPTNVAVYAQLARAQSLAKQQPRACYAYRIFLKSVPDGPDRKKASAESDQCERQLRALKKQPADPTKGFVDLRATFFSALDAKLLWGEGSASESLKTLVHDGFLGPELADMAAKLAAVAIAEAQGIQRRVLAGEQLAAEVLRSARPAFQLAQDLGSPEASGRGTMAFLDGLAELSERSFKKAEAHFVEASKADPANRDYLFARGLALFMAGERVGALKILEADLRDDPRTTALRLSVSLSSSPEAGAAELERVLFSTRFTVEK